MKKLITGAALALLLASPALAKSNHARSLSQDNAVLAFGSTDLYGAAAGPFSVVVGNQIVGSDPDPAVRLQLRRDSATGSNQ